MEHHLRSHCSECGQLYPEAKAKLIAQDKQEFEIIRLKVIGELGLKIPSFKEALNEYGGVEYWWTFDYRDAKLTLGRRKRVTAIKAVATKTFSIAKLRELAERDRVTFLPFVGVIPVEDCVELTEDEKAMLLRYGIKEVDKTVANHALKVEIHAWNDFHVVEYLSTLLLELGQGTSPTFGQSL